MVSLPFRYSRVMNNVYRKDTHDMDNKVLKLAANMEKGCAMSLSGFDL